MGSNFDPRKNKDILDYYIDTSMCVLSSVYYTIAPSNIHQTSLKHLMGRPFHIKKFRFREKFTLYRRQRFNFKFSEIMGVGNYG